MWDSFIVRHKTVVFVLPGIFADGKMPMLGEGEFELDEIKTRPVGVALATLKRGFDPVGVASATLATGLGDSQCVVPPSRWTTFGGGGVIVCIVVVAFVVMPSLFNIYSWPDFGVQYLADFWDQL